METIDVSPEVERLSLELLDELGGNEMRVVDPRSVPLRVTHLEQFVRSPAHVRHSMVSGYGDQTLSTRIGSGTHAISFGTPKVVVYSKRRAGKEWDTFAKEHGGCCILNDREFAQATAIANSIRRNKIAERILFSEGTILEGRIDWEWNGRKCRSTPDARNFRTLADLKSCRTAEPEKFKRDALRFAYPAKLAWYRRAIEAATGVRTRENYLIAVEQAAPYAVTPFQLTERALEAGDRLVRKWFEQLRVCEETNHWPEYTLGVEEFDVVDFDAEVDLAMRDDDGIRADVSF
jgi:hypothetical protein